VKKKKVWPKALNPQSCVRPKFKWFQGEKEIYPLLCGTTKKRGKKGKIWPNEVMELRKRLTAP